MELVNDAVKDDISLEGFRALLHNGNQVTSDDEFDSGVVRNDSKMEVVYV